MNTMRVVLVGRTNVGKSTLFNRLSHDTKSLTLHYAGVTRDILKGSSTWKGHDFTVIDTGGISLRKTTDPLLAQVQTRALDALAQATVILFVVDGTAGITTEDHAIAKELHKHGRPVILVVNKGDTKLAQETMHEFVRLGHGEPLLISAQHGTGMVELLDRIMEHLPTTAEPTQEVHNKPLHIAIIGKPNVGKSSLMNKLVEYERSIVADIPGTTREALTEKITFSQQDLLLSDTAGIRRKRSVEEPIEKLMVGSTLRTIDDADIVLLVVDGSQGSLADQELKLAFYIFEQKYKGLIILYNKQDLVQEYAAQMLAMDKEKYEYFLSKVASLSISCVSGKNLGKILPLVEQVAQRYCQQLDDEDLTACAKEALMHKPLYHQSKLLIVRRIKHISTRPPTLLMIANEPKWFGQSQLGFFDNLLRKKYALQGVPLRFLVRKTG